MTINNSNKDTVKKENLSGYRSPNIDEQTRIAHYMEKQIKKERKLWNSLKFVCIFLNIALILKLFGIGKTNSVGEAVVILTIVILLTIFVFCLNKAIKSDRLFLKLLKDGEFQVMDCKIYKADSVGIRVNRAIIYIYNEYGEYCYENFIRIICC